MIRTTKILSRKSSNSSFCSPKVAFRLFARIISRRLVPRSANLWLTIMDRRSELRLALTVRKQRKNRRRPYKMPFRISCPLARTFRSTRSASKGFKGKLSTRTTTKILHPVPSQCKILQTLLLQMLWSILKYPTIKLNPRFGCSKTSHLLCKFRTLHNRWSHSQSSSLFKWLTVAL